MKQHKTELESQMGAADSQSTAVETAKSPRRRSSLQKRIVVCICVSLALLLVAAGALCALNFLVDPYGVFGDRVYEWDAYSMTQSPLIGKIEYLERNADRYNGYIFGTDGCSGYDVGMLNEALGAQFFDMSAGDAGMRDVLAAASYAAKRGNCDYILLEVSPKDACMWETQQETMHPLLTGASSAGFSLKKLFAAPVDAFEKMRADTGRENPLNSKIFYDSETGAQTDISADNTRLGTIRDYTSSYGAKFRTMRTRTMTYTNELTVAVGEFAGLCEKNMIDLYVVVPPLYQNELAVYDKEEMNHFFDFLSMVTGYYDFSGSNEITEDARYFYDNTHYRRSLGDSMLTAILEDDADNMPENFCQYVEKGTAGVTYFSDRMAQTNRPWEYEIEVPIIRYGNITQTVTGETDAVTVEQFEAQIQAISDAGYTAVLYKDLIAYVENGMILPEKPLVIAFDGGYSSVLNLACPVLAAHKQCATVAVNGSEIGKNTYQNTNIAMPAHFTLYEAKDYIDAGVLELQSHTYDLHADGSSDSQPTEQEKEHEDEKTVIRKGVLRLDTERFADYRRVMENDYARINELIDCSVGTEVRAVTYPYGAYDLLAAYELHRLGVKVTATSESGINCLVRGLNQSLYDLNRVNAAKAADGETLVKMLEMLR